MTDRRPSLLYYNPVGVIGGAEMCLLDLLQAVRRARPDWRLSVVLGDDGPLRGAVEALGARCLVEPLPAALAGLGDSAGGGVGLVARLLRSIPEGVAALGRLRRLFRAERPALIQTNGMKAHLLGTWAAPRGVPVVWYLHDYLGARPAMARLLRGARRPGLEVVAVSRSVADDARRVLGPSVSIRVIPNAVDLGRFAPGPPRSPGSPVRVGLVATFARWKGHEVFLGAVARIAPEVPARFSIIGGPIYRSAGSQWSTAEIEGEVDRRGLAGRVERVGHVADPSAIFRGLDVVVHASTRPEPFGRVIIEGMASGLAVIAVAEGGAAELFEDEVSGLAFASGDPASLARAIGRLVDDPELRRRLGEAGRRVVQARFDASRLFEGWGPVYADRRKDRGLEAPESSFVQEVASSHAR